MNGPGGTHASGKPDKARDKLRALGYEGFDMNANRATFFGYWFSYPLNPAELGTRVL